MSENNGSFNVKDARFTLPDVVKIVALVAGAVAVFFQVNGRLDNLDAQITALRSEQVQLRADVAVVRSQTDEEVSSPDGRSRLRTRSVTD